MKRLENLQDFIGPIDEIIRALQEHKKAGMQYAATDAGQYSVSIQGFTDVEDTKKTYPDYVGKYCAIYSLSCGVIGVCDETSIAHALKEDPGTFAIPIPQKTFMAFGDDRPWRSIDGMHPHPNKRDKEGFITWNKKLRARPYNLASISVSTSAL